jgi:ubiquinone/menaquinone biosynthesis C-methylase UbiE
MKKSDVKDVWNEASDSWSEFVREGKDIARDDMNNPTVFELLGDITGKRVLDLACGEGYNSRLMAKQGASVVGVDFSDKLIDLALETENKDKLGIGYHVLDTSNMDIFENESFDIVVCIMAMMDIQDYQGAIEEVSRVLKKSGRFVFSITHPCFEARVVNGKLIGGWEFKEGVDENDTDKALYYKVDRYFDTKDAEEIPWEMERLNKPFKTIAFHRTLSEYSEVLNKNNLLISRLVEPKPSEKGIEKLPVLKGCLRVPLFIVIETVKR